MKAELKARKHPRAANTGSGDPGSRRWKEAAILRAEAKRETAIREADGQAAAIRKIQEATAVGLQMIKDVQADSSVIALQSLETMTKVANGKATKIIVPSELQNLATLGTVLKEAATDLDSTKMNNQGTSAAPSKSPVSGSSQIHQRPPFK